MRKIETIWHHILYMAAEKELYKHTQQGLADDFGYSISTVNHALEIPTAMGAIRKAGKFFVLEDFRKLLYYWASVRELDKDVVYMTRSDLSAREIEKLAVPDSILAGYVAAKHILGEPPADYTQVHFYVMEQQLEELKRRFPAISKIDKHEANVLAFRAPEVMQQYGHITTIIQTFVDIWNFSDWYSRDFISALEKKMDGLLS